MPGLVESENKGAPSVSSFRADLSVIAEFVEQLAGEFFYDGPDRRSNPRYEITLPVFVAPLDEKLRSLEYLIRASTRNISVSGVSLVCMDPIGSPSLAIQFKSPSGNEVTVLAEVVHSTAQGYFHQVGCKFLGLHS